ncbi:type II secretion system protein GspM [Undibacterium sp.]|jgi:general secretion pathway protein M|uniref:type II secretion system protein GspM n=1 Tax=Undibacterium sp. TaxID=1914977 RepID=UPI0025D1B60E|nr:type II secretion system protein GspM [Undibacterium sp.]MCX7217733.1 type II secretion system protein GspM [Burkholderiales bacterium]
MKQSMMLEAAASFWQQRDARERLWLSVGIASIFLAIVYLIFVNPALSNRANLEKKIPQLRLQVAEMAVMSGQYAKIAGEMTADVAPVTREVIESSLQRRGLKAQTLTTADDVVRLQITAASYSNLMEWLLEMQKAARLTVEEIKLTTLTEVGQVSVVLTLKQQKSAF